MTCEHKNVSIKAPRFFCLDGMRYFCVDCGHHLKFNEYFSALLWLCAFKSFHPTFEDMRGAGEWEAEEYV